MASISLADSKRHWRSALVLPSLSVDQDFLFVFEQRVLEEPERKERLERAQPNKILAVDRVARRSPFDGFFQLGGVQDLSQRDQLVAPLLVAINVLVDGLEAFHGVIRPQSFSCSR